MAVGGVEVARGGDDRRTAESRGAEASQLERGDPTSPTAFVQPASRRLIWIVDRPASSRLKGHLHG